MNSKRKYFFFIISALLFVPLYIYGLNNQQWISHISYSGDINEIAQNGDYIYALTDGKLFIYNQSDESLSEYIKYDRGNSNITHIAYNKKNKCLVVVRSDADIDLLYENQSYYTISDLKNYLSQNIDKTINGIFVTDDFAYLSTNYGFSIIDISRKEIKDSGMFNTKFYSICTSPDNKLYAATEIGIRVADLNDTNINILDLTNWKEFPLSKYYKDADYTFKDENIRGILSFKDKLHFLYPDSAVYIMDNPESVKSVLKGSKPSKMYFTNNDHLMILNKSNFWEYTDLSTQNSFAINSLNYVIPNGNKLNEYWISASGYNLSLGKGIDSKIEFEKQWIAPQGPATNSPFSQTIQNDQLLITGGGYYLAPYDNPASLSVYKNRKWSNIYQGTITSETGISTEDFGYAVSSPSNSNKIFASSWGQGLYEFNEGSIKRYDTTNSPLKELVRENDYRRIRVGGMAYDKSGNLWMLNSMVKNTIQVYKNNEQWATPYYFQEIDGILVPTNTKCIFIDRYSNKWIGTLGESNYLFVLNSGNTAYKTIYKGSFKDRDGNTLDITDINDITEDVDGTIWVATNIGPYYINNSSNITSKESLPLTKIKINKETGSGSVTGLLEDAFISAIKVDGANRKWIATQTSGVFLLSSDNKDILEHFTTDNSPLPSNNIISLSIDPKNGDVYIGSNRGLMAYRSTITPGSDDLSNIHVYPNPVRPEYSGIITIAGLEVDTDIKITDIKGNLIVEGRSLGGQFTWDGLSTKGKKVDTGVYLVFANTENGSKSEVTKIMIIR